MNDSFLSLIFKFLELNIMKVKENDFFIYLYKYKRNRKEKTLRIFTIDVCLEKSSLYS
jgi:hypothetical protein